MKKIILVQPPFVQLNSPYPAPYYLKSFLEKRGFEVRVLDHSIGLFERIFSRSGLEQIFLSTLSLPASGDKKTAYNIERFLSEKELWLASIDRLVTFLRGRDNEWGHFLALANGFVPGGPRSDAFLALRAGDVSPDEAKLFATLLLSDLADFISAAVDSGFELIRYTGETDAYIMNSFYRPMLAEEWNKLAGETTEPFLLGITIPFPGCLPAALVCAESAKKRFGSAVSTIAGGGYVNTELRFLETPEFFDYFDYVSFDKGYGSLAAVLERFETGENSGKPLYKTMFRFQGAVINPADEETSGVLPPHPSINLPVLENSTVRTNFPDYTSVDFDRYIYPVDDSNPMHRLWSDGHWLKAYLAHGCYWHSCAFCDVTLDYIKNFIPVDVPALFAYLKNQAEKTGVRGIHLCDEAAPLSSLLEFALLNREAGLPFSFWGNIRFEKDFCPDAAAILAAGGLIGVSAGIEVATERGFMATGKGISLQSAVRACAAFKEMGILTHAYLIFGYWDQDEQEIMDSAETLRQLFEHGLLDSAYWHKFILTRHSRIYAEKQRGLHPGLKIKGEPARNGAPNCGRIFALNDLSFEGEEKYDKYTEGLDKLLAVWMAGETETPVEEGFSFSVKTPAIPPDHIEKLLDEYANDRDRNRAVFPGAGAAGKRVLFLGSYPRPFSTGKACRQNQAAELRWRWLLAERELKAGGAAAGELAVLLEAASRGRGMDAAEFCAALEKIAGEAGTRALWSSLRESGLAVW